MILTHSPKGALHQEVQGSESILWVGALSHEERALHSLGQICQRVPVTHAACLRYQAETGPAREAESQSESNIARISSWSSRGWIRDDVQTIDIGPYGYWDLCDEITTVLTERAWNTILIDISCFTKLHTVALGQCLAGSAADGMYILYTVPETYGHLDAATAQTQRTGWRDVLVLPLGKAPGMGDESHSRGIIMPGHEGDRLLVALAEAEPAGGIVLMAHLWERPDFRLTAKSSNSSILYDLRLGHERAWAEHTVDIAHPHVIANLVQQELASLAPVEAPMYLFPFGPKPFALSAALALCEYYEARSWLVYPVPSSHAADSSFGVERTLAYRCTT